MKSTKIEPASTRPFEYLPTLPSGMVDSHRFLALKQPIDLVAALPLLLGEELNGYLIVVFVERDDNRIFGIARLALPTSESEERECVESVRFMAEAHAHFNSTPMAIVAFSNRGSGTEYESNLLAILNDLRDFHDDQTRTAAFIVSADSTSAIDLFDPDRVAISLEEPRAQLRRDLEQKREAEEKLVSDLCQQLNGGPKAKSSALAKHLESLRQKSRTSTKYRRGVEDGLFTWLTADPEPSLLELGQSTEFERLDEPQAITWATWVAGVSDRRVREPLLKRLHSASQAVSGSQRSEFLQRAQRQLVALIKAAPTQETAALSSILALLAWQNGDRSHARAAVRFGCEQDPDNVLLQLVAGATASGLPQSTWAEIMGDYSLTQLRSG